jgi:hypothetical protein
MWGVVVTVVTGVVRKHVPAEYQNQVLDTILWVVQWFIGIGIMVYGRWTAKQPLGLGGLVRGLIKCVPLMMMLGLSGCMTRAEHAAILNVVERAEGSQTKTLLDLQGTIAGDWNGDGTVTAADDAVPAEQRKKLPDLSSYSVVQRNAYLQAFKRRADELRATFQQARDQAATPMAPAPVQSAPTASPLSPDVVIPD